MQLSLSLLLSFQNVDIIGEPLSPPKWNDRRLVLLQCHVEERQHITLFLILLFQLRLRQWARFPLTHASLS